MENSDLEILLKLDPRTLRVLKYTIVDKPLQEERKKENEKHFKENQRFTAEAFKERVNPLTLELQRTSQREKLGENPLNPSKFSSKGRIQCCGKFRNQELHELHSKKEGAHTKELPKQQREPVNRRFTDRVEKRETLSSLTKNQLEELLELATKMLESK